MNAKELKELRKKSREIIKNLKALEKKFGPQAVRYSMRKYLNRVAEEQKRIREIRKLEKELEELKKRRF